MVRQRASSVLPRYLNPSYFLRRPRRLLLLFAFFVCSTVFLWDRHNLVVNHEEAIREIGRQNDKLEHELLKLANLLKDKGETLPKELELQEHERSVSESTGGQTGGLFQFFHPKRRKPPEIDVDEDPVTAGRREKVKDAMLHAWTCYERYAWGMDELKPRSKNGENQFAGLGATIIDSLDTLYIMGFQKQFERARDWVAENLNFNQNVETSVFETTIRAQTVRFWELSTRLCRWVARSLFTDVIYKNTYEVLGGLLSAYDLAGEPMFLRKAQEVADRLMPAWDTPSGIPYSTINLATGYASNPGWSGGASILADLGTEQVELIALSQRTGASKYKEKAEKVIKQLRKVFPSDGLLPYYINPDSGEPNSDGVITFGAMGDSFYEYLLKVWILGNRTEVVKHYREMWEQSMEGMKSLVFRTTDGYTYLAEKSGSQLIKKMDELACFAPGMLVLGMEGASPENAKEYLNLAEELAKTCYNMYMSTPTKLAGENYNFDDAGMNLGVHWNILRPETIESFMYLWRKTRNQKYRDWGWDIFLAFEAQSRIPTGYVGLKDVSTGEKDDKMQSFFLAETLKYLYLLFSPSTVIPLDEWVFDTEAHPVRIVARQGEPISLEDANVRKRRFKPMNQAGLQIEQRQRWRGRGIQFSSLPK